MMRPGLRRIAIAAAIGAGLVLAPVLGFLIYAARLPPLDLAALYDRSTIVVDRDGKLLRPFVMRDGRWRMPITAREVDPRYLDMLIAYEDRRFRMHGGVDPVALLRASWQLLTHGRIVSGASTISMQVARLAEPREGDGVSGRGLAAKLRQMTRAIELERRIGKDGILDLYLSLAPMGGNLEGVRAAALAYFGKEPARLSTAEAALLVAIPQAPETRRPDRFPHRAEGARERVIARMRAFKLLPEADFARALDEPVPVARRPFPHLAAHRAEAMVAEHPARHRIETTFVRDWQASLERLARERAEALGPALSVAIVVIDHETGAIRASIGGADYFSHARKGGIDLAGAIRSPGSALKPFIYALAFDNGIAHPETMLEDRPLRFGTYAPDNFDTTFQGMTSARTALQMSLNLPAVDLLSALGPQKFLARLRQAGAMIATPDQSAPGLAVGLGGLGVSLRDLTMLYAGLARGGAVHRAFDMMAEPAGSAPQGSLRPLPEKAEAQALVSPVAAWYVADILLGAPPPENGAPGRIAFKTGTSYGYRDAWAVGFDRRHTIGIWVGRADNGATPGLIGRRVAAPILFDAFARIGLEPGLPARPLEAITATNAQLPPPLRHIRQDVPKTSAALLRQGLQIAFPPNGAAIDAASNRMDGRPWLVVKVTGGAAPFTYLVNGAPVSGRVGRREFGLPPDGLGFVEIAVIDAKGASDQVTVRLQ